MIPVLKSLCVPKAALSVLLCACLLVVPLGISGCSYSQAQVSAAIQRVENGLKTTEALLPQAEVIEADLRTVAPEVAEYLAPILANAKPALEKVIAACDAYLANPGADAFQAILNGADAITAQVDQAALRIAGIKNPDSRQKAATYVGLASTGLHVALGILENYATKKQVQAVKSARAHVPFEQVRPFINREYARQELVDLGYDQPDRILAAAGL
jgi:hypothetical protein